MYFKPKRWICRSQVAKETCNKCPVILPVAWCRIPGISAPFLSFGGLWTASTLDQETKESVLLSCPLPIIQYWTKKLVQEFHVVKHPHFKNPWSNWFNFVFNVGSLMLLWILCFQEKQACHLTAIKRFAWSAIVYQPKKNVCNWLENGTWEIYSSSMVYFSPSKHFQIFPSVSKY